MFPDKNEKKKKRIRRGLERAIKRRKKKLNGYLLTRKETCERKGENMGIAKKWQL